MANRRITLEEAEKRLSLGRDVFVSTFTNSILTPIKKNRNPVYKYLLGGLDGVECKELCPSWTFYAFTYTTTEAFSHVLTTGQTLYGTLRENGSTFRLIRDSGRIRCQQFVGGFNKVSADPPIDATWEDSPIEDPPIPAPVKGSGPPHLSLQDIRLSLNETRKNWPGLIDLFWTITPKLADPTPLPEAIRGLLQKDAGEVKFYGKGTMYSYVLGKKRTGIYCTCSSDPTKEVPIPTAVLWGNTPFSAPDSTQGNATIQGVELPPEFTEALEHAQSYWKGTIQLSWTITPWKKS